MLMHLPQVASPTRNSPPLLCYLGLLLHETNVVFTQSSDRPHADLQHHMNDRRASSTGWSSHAGQGFRLNDESSANSYDTSRSQENRVQIVHLRGQPQLLMRLMHINSQLLELGEASLNIAEPLAPTCNTKIPKANRNEERSKTAYTAKFVRSDPRKAPGSACIANLENLWLITAMRRATATSQEECKLTKGSAGRRPKVPHRESAVTMPVETTPQGYTSRIGIIQKCEGP